VNAIEKGDATTLFLVFLAAAMLAAFTRAETETVIPRDEALLTDWVEGE
jgi:hypothetical protein